jgi:glutathione S-transferase
MQLYLNKASPYARLAMVVVHDKQLAERVQLKWTDPWASPAELLAVNPVAKVPALVTDGGVSIVDSACICGYLDDVGSGARLHPAPDAAGVVTYMKYGLGRGLIDTAFGVTIERRFATPKSEPVLAARWLDAVRRTLATLDKDPELLRGAGQPDIGDLALAVALAYVGFRLQEVDWQRNAPSTARWFSRIDARASMRMTRPE